MPLFALYTVSVLCRFGDLTDSFFVREKGNQINRIDHDVAFRHTVPAMRHTLKFSLLPCGLYLLTPHMNPPLLLCSFFLKPHWYLCGMPRAAVKQIAVRLKQQGGPGTFIIRDVQSLPNAMALCIKLPVGKLGNYVIEQKRTDR